MDFVIFAFCAIILAMLIRSKRAFNRVFSNPYVNVCKYTTALSNLKLINSVSVKKIRKESSDRIYDQMMREVKITLVNVDSNYHNKKNITRYTSLLVGLRIINSRLAKKIRESHGDYSFDEAMLDDVETPPPKRAH